MSRAYIVTRNGGTVTKAPINDNKIPIYANETALDADLNNLPDGIICATSSGHDDVIDQMKAYIRNQNLLSDWETVTLSSDSNNPTIIPYDGFIAISDLYNGNVGYTQLFVNGTRVCGENMYGSTGSGDNQSDGFTVPVVKGQSVYIAVSSISTTSHRAAYYKQRDYTDR